MKGRTLTSWPSLRTDIDNAGGSWVDEEVVVMHERTRIPSLPARKPDDLKAFCVQFVETFARRGRCPNEVADPIVWQGGPGHQSA